MFSADEDHGRIDAIGLRSLHRQAHKQSLSASVVKPKWQESSSMRTYDVNRGMFSCELEFRHHFRNGP